MHLYKLIATSIIFIFSAMLAVNATAQSDPVPMLKNIADNMISGLKSNKATLKTKPGVVYDLAYKYIVPHADLTFMAKRVLPRDTWNNATASQRSQFEHEFTRTLIRTYASALSSYEDQSINFFPPRSNSGRSIVVRSEITSSDHQPIQVAYRLLNSNGNWKLYDMSVEGVSMLESFRSQFADILAHGSMDELLKRMGAHNRR